MVNEQHLPLRPNRALRIEGGASRRYACRLPAWLNLTLALIALLIGWQVVVTVQNYPPFILPAPTLVFQRLATELAGDTLPRHILVTLSAAVCGFGIALAISLLLGYVLAHVRAFDRVLTPLLAASQAVPIVAIAPLIVLWVGVGLESRVLVATLITFFPILSATIVAFRSVPRELIDMARISGANRWHLLRYVELPLALPGIFGGVKAGLALATTGAVVGEFVGGRDGLGALINIARGLFDTPLMFVALTVLAGITLILFLIALLIERLLITWEA
ncbi:MAG: ABC transporter permease [Roseiflexus sp.]|nr:ABC transporter permease [Roseiflexus sp.]MCS7290165.1 ABC transporter permease [Roseiflexus sp.]MDW8148775.1 ABC transporter permease [Roseiflexaceae bacterium]MDW8232612.1 ABC transporter permease [Roseiflexaceae bacterium]